MARVAAGLCRIAALGMLLVLARPAWSTDPDPEIDDILRTVQARKLLCEDGVLGPLNLGVRVRNRVAVLWGPVDSIELSLRAEQRLRTMIELREVRNEMYVESGDAMSPDEPRGPGTPLYLPEPPTPRAPFVPEQKSRRVLPRLEAPPELLSLLRP